MKVLKVIGFPKDTPLTERIEYAGNQLRDWFKSLRQPIYLSIEGLRLSKCKLDKKGYYYYYEIVTEKESPSSKHYVSLSEEIVKSNQP